MRKRSIFHSFKNAIDGIYGALRNERNLRIHIVIALITITLAWYVNITPMEWAILMIVIALVISLELINTAIEVTLDLITDEYNESVKKAKDIAAGAVLIMAIAAIIVGICIFYPKIMIILESKFTSINIALLIKGISIVFIVTCIVIIFKILMGNKENVLHGGFPSGHSAVAFSIATIITELAVAKEIVVLSYIMAAIIAQSRVEARVHKISEVLAGGFIGIVVTKILLLIIPLY